MEKTILQYEISDWSQLPDCMSNNSPDLKISVCKFVQNDDIKGTKVELTHPIYGTLLAYTILPKGNLITDITDKDLDVMHSKTLLNELRRYGFYIDLVEENNLPYGQVEILRTLKSLNFDKIRIFSVHDIDDDFLNTIRVTAFNIKSHPYWINSGYSPSYKEWSDAILDGTALNVSGIEESKKYSWDWMYNAIFDIDDILSRYDENA